MVRPCVMRAGWRTDWRAAGGKRRATAPRAPAAPPARARRAKRPSGRRAQRRWRHRTHVHLQRKRKGSQQLQQQVLVRHAATGVSAAAATAIIIIIITVPNSSRQWRRTAEQPVRRQTAAAAPTAPSTPHAALLQTLAAPAAASPARARQPGVGGSAGAGRHARTHTLDGGALEGQQAQRQAPPLHARRHVRQRRVVWPGLWSATAGAQGMQAAGACAHRWRRRQRRRSARS